MAQHPTGTVTFLFTDVEGSTARWEHFPSAMRQALERHDDLLRACIAAHRGLVFKTVGDAFCAAFHTPIEAARAAVDAQHAVAAEDWTAFAPDFPPLRVRMGIHIGVAQERGGDYFGPAVNRTARLEAAGHGGQVLLSLATQQLMQSDLPPDWALRDWGTHRLKDLRHADRIFQILAPGLEDVAAPPRTATALAPRDRVLVEDVLADAGDDMEQGVATALASPSIHRPVGISDLLAATLAAVRDDDAPAVVLSAALAREAAARRPDDLTEYRLGRIAAWSQPRYRLDGRFVALSLLVDQGEDAPGGRWAARAERHSDLGALLAEVPEPALVVLGPPGSGKSTLLRHYELEAAIGGLRAGASSAPVTFFAQLNQYKPERVGDPPPAPGNWLADRWSAAYPNLPPLPSLLATGRMVLLLDALNEMPAATERAFREHVATWKQWLVRLTSEQPGNRVVFSCRTLDYSAPLSTPALRVPQVQIEPLADAQVEAFLRAYSPVHGADIWTALAGTPQLDALRAPFFLALLVDQIEATGDRALDRAGLFTGFVRQALRREVERDNPLFARDDLLADRDIRRIAQRRWLDAYDLPERGALIPRLTALAFGMQATAADGGARQVRLSYDAALNIIDHPADEAILKAGVAISALDEDPAADEVMYRHQLLQEYFAARVVARAPEPERVAAPWRAADIRPGVPELLATLPAGEALPPLAQTGWEETTALAAVMADDPVAFVRGVMRANLALAGRCAVQVAAAADARGRAACTASDSIPGAGGRAAMPRGEGVDDGSPRLPPDLLHDLRRALVERSRDPGADLRDRIACALVLGDLGDPRYERHTGPFGPYLLPPLAAIPGGAYTIGDDTPICREFNGQVEHVAGHVPRHTIAVDPFNIARFPVTNAEWRCFMAAGGYDDERWWDTDAARAWRRGELANEGAKDNNRYWRRRFQADPGLFELSIATGRFPNEEAVQRWRGWMTLDDEAFEAVLAAQWQARRMAEPAFWHEARFNASAQPVLGVCWFEARAYGRWLSAQSGRAFRLPTEAEWEAAARGRAGRLYPHGDAFDPAKGNTYETRLNRPSPVGVFLEGDTPEGVSDMCGNACQWTSSAWGDAAGMRALTAGEPGGDGTLAFPYPYDASDGREDPNLGIGCLRVLRGSAWSRSRFDALAAVRLEFAPYLRDFAFGVRLVESAAEP